MNHLLKSNYWMQIASICILFLFGLLSNVRGAESAFIETALKTNETFWVGQRITITVHIAVEGRFDGSTLFDLPKVARAFLLKPEERPVLSTRNIQNKEYTVQSHSLVLFSQREGEVVIPEFRVRCGSTKGIDSPPTEHSLKVPSIRITTQLPQGSKPGQVIVTTTRLEIKERWTGKKDVYKVGDALTRVVNLKADGLPGMILPPLPSWNQEGIAVYPEEPSLKDTNNRGTYSGEREDSVTYVFETPGPVTIPPIVYRWWNPSESSWQEKTLEALELAVADNVANTKPSTADGTPSPTSKGSGWLWWLVPGLIAAFTGFFVLRLQKTQEPEAITFQSLMEACRSQNASEVYGLLSTWQAILGVTAEEMPPSLRQTCVELQRVMIGHQKNWPADGLVDQLATWRHALRKDKHRNDQERVLPELNPRIEKSGRR